MTLLNTQTSPGQAPVFTFPRDHHQRRSLRFDEQSFEHQAKTNLNWLGHLIHLYTQPGQTLLDPMGGTGSILLALYTGRQVITGDVETPWAQLQQQNALRIHTESLFSAPAQVGQWDASHLPLPSSSIPVIITSPPYFDLFSNWNAHSGNSLTRTTLGPNGSCYGFHPRQLANIHVYETYLRAMIQVYRECQRVLVPGGTLVLIVGDKVHKANVVPVTADTQTLCHAIGFSLTGREQRRTIPSRYRRICAANNPDYPMITTETALVYQKPPAAEQSYPRRISIIQAPTPDNSPGRQLYDKQLYWAERRCHHILTLNGPGALKPYSIAGHQPNPVWTDAPANAQRRREWAFEVVRQLVSLADVLAGDVVHLHVSHDYAPYLQRRLNTIGCHVTTTTEHLNLGQKLAWYTLQNQKGDQLQ